MRPTLSVAFQRAPRLLLTFHCLTTEGTDQVAASGDSIYAHVISTAQYIKRLSRYRALTVHVNSLEELWRTQFLECMAPRLWNAERAKAEAWEPAVRRHESHCLRLIT
jgi:hypothetical protein